MAGFCTQCRNARGAGEIFCAKCGHPFSHDTPGTPAAPLLQNVFGAAAAPLQQNVFAGAAAPLQQNDFGAAAAPAEAAPGMTWRDSVRLKSVARMVKLPTSVERRAAVPAPPETPEAKRRKIASPVASQAPLLVRTSVTVLPLLISRQTGKGHDWNIVDMRPYAQDLRNFQVCFLHAVLPRRFLWCLFCV